MIVFWRLLLTYYICALLFYNQRFFTWRDKRPVWTAILQGICFAVLASIMCGSYLTMDWQLAELLPMPGWGGVFVCGVLYALLNALLVERRGQTKGYAATFLIHDILCVLVLFACSPLHMLYHTGNFMLEPLTVFFVGLIVVTRMFNIFIYMVERDLYGRDYPTIDENFVTMMMRLIFFLLVLLPGWRWVLWFVVWFLVCEEAYKNRLMDLSRFALYFSIFGAAAVGFMVRYGWYWI